MALTKITSDVIGTGAVTSDHLASGAVTHSSLSSITTDNVSEGSTNTYFTNARARGSVSVTGGNLSYDSATGVIQLTTDQIRTAVSGGTGVSISAGEISIGQDVATSSTPTFGNITTTGYIAGPATFTIDPAAVGDNTGTVVIAGNLQVDGTTTTINSTTMEVDDLNITLASGAANAAAADGAGITVDGASATITYDGTNDEWDFNKDINVTGTITSSGNITGTSYYVGGSNIIDTSRNLTNIGTISSGDITSSGFLRVYDGGSQAFGFFKEKTILGTGTSNNLCLFAESITDGGEIHFMTGGSGTKRVTIDASGNVGMGIDPTTRLHMKGTGDMIRLESTNPGAGGAQMDMLHFSPSTANEDTMAAINMGGYYSGTSSAYFGAIRCIATDAGARHGRLEFYTRDDSAFNTALTISHDSNVGIGGAPDSSGRLLVQNGGTNQIVLTQNDSATTNLNMGNFSGGGYISQNYYYSSGHQADDNTKGAYEIFIGDDLFGINYHSAGAMGSRRRDFAITSAGNVGMGTNNPSFASGSGLEIERAGIATLRFQNTSSGKSVEITQDSDFKIESMNSASDILLMPTANVGIGTESPLSNNKLHVNGNVHIGDGEDYSSYAKLAVYGNVYQGDVGLLIKNDRYNDSTATASLIFEHRTHAGQGNAAKIVCRRQSGYNESAGSKDAALDFYTANGGTLAHRMQIDRNGNVGIGTGTASISLPFIVQDGTTDQQFRLSAASSSINTMHAGFGCSPSTDITIQTQGHGALWRFGANVSNGNAYWINSSNVGVNFASGSNAWSAHSDERLKENITDIGPVLDKIQNYRCVSFNFKSSPEKELIGFIAQDWETDFPEVVDEDNAFTIQDDGSLVEANKEGNVSTAKVKSIAYTETIPVLLKAIQELSTKLDAAEARITELEG